MQQDERPLWPHQIQAINEALTHPKRMLHWCPRLGKSRATVEIVKVWDKPRGVIVAPLIVCEMWSGLLKAEGFHVYDAYKGPVEAVRGPLRVKGVKSYVIINWDRIGPLIEDLLKFKPDFVVYDEVHWMKSPSAKRARAARRLAWATPLFRGLTGTPIPNHYGDLWSSMTCVDPEKWNKAHGKFAARHLIRHPMYPSTIVGYLDLPRIERLVREGAHTVRREDVFGPDQYQFVRRTVTLPSAAAVLYRVLAKEWVLDSPKLTAEHVLKRLVRLQQLTSGYLPLDEGGLKEVHTAKIDAVIADLGEIVEAGEKVIIFHKFRWEGDRYEREIAQHFPGISVLRIAGGVSADDRVLAIASIAESVGSAVVIAQEQAGGIGISFAEAKHVMFVSSTYSFVGRKQAMDRIYKPGLTRCVTDYIVEGTIDVSIEKAIASKSSLHESLRNSDRTSLVFGE